ncbi:hypothetical protein DENSPDRAFT_830686 [Dentipellis sp. KUC8613]|nr:hypothetical protein DENSPDRAFT_830686 [Dentipellis sp. KUC8613]
MAARKLQTEIDRTLKKVAEGVEVFESIYEKMQASTNQTQKEKQEMDLKTQIKKLQRLRDQIKTWVASNDIKDKTPLLENRRLIETQMEKFKACEKEMKTKAFSKEGLIQSAKLDPEQQKKQECTQWLQSCVEDLLLQVETAEAEIETLQVGGRKKGKVGATTQERLENLEHRNERRKWHISRLEIILRLLDNGTLSSDQVNGLKEDVQYFLESNNGDADFEEDEGLYDELNLDEEEEKFGKLMVDGRESDSDEASEEDLPPRTPSKKHDEESVTSSKQDSPIMKKATVTLQLRKHSSAAEAPRPPPNPNFAQQPMSSILKAGLPVQQAKPPVLPPIKYAAAAAAAVTPSTSQNNATNGTTSTPTSAASGSQPAPPPAAALTSPRVSTQPTANTTITQETYNASMSSPSLTHPSTTSPLLSSTSVQPPDGSFSSPALSESVSGAGASASVSSPSRNAAQSPQVRTQSPAAGQALADAQPQSNGAWPAQAANALAAPQPSGPSPLPQQVQQPAPAPPGMQSQNAPSSSSSPHPQSQPQPQFPPGVKVEPAQNQNQSQSQGQGMPIAGAQQAPGARPPSAMLPQLQPQPPRAPSTSNANVFPGSLSDLVVSFENVKQKAAHRMTNLDQVHKLLEGGYSNLPQPQDTEKPKYYVPRNPYQTPSYYPQTTNPILSSPGLFAQLDVETLFYVFYFLPGTYQQYLAAKELKRQSWRFHVKYLTWFQRHSEPQAITDEYEQGVYVYFDWEGSWCQRKKSDFRFEYRYLSED